MVERYDPRHNRQTLAFRRICNRRLHFQTDLKVRRRCGTRSSSVGTLLPPCSLRPARAVQGIRRGLPSQSIHHFPIVLRKQNPNRCNGTRQAIHAA